MRPPPTIDGLPSPEPEDRERSLALVERVRAEAISRGGVLGFDRYMAIALYEPGLGYYASGSGKFGPGGDFVTAPELGALFAACIATQLERWFAAGVPPIVWEFGAGSGALASQLLAEFAARGVAVEVCIVELSAPLRARQRERIAALGPAALERVSWFDRLPDAIEGAVLANELLDALPVRLFEIPGGGDSTVFERVIRPDPGGPGLVLDSVAADPTFASLIDQRLASAGWPSARSPGRYRSEVGEQASAWVATIAERLQCGVMLLIDYGFPATEYYHPQRADGTLNCHYRHRSHAAPLWWPGLNDITAHVDFSAVRASALATGLSCIGYGSQASFLLGCDFAAHFTARAGAGALAQASLAREANTLVSEAEMGELFKVIALARTVQGQSLGFAGRDRQQALGD